uniref:Uncharacterized protein n=1 Tax=Steinernema glaseri TaxID=37863 RepID=A0A1I8AW52_9BILA
MTQNKSRLRKTSPRAKVTARSIVANHTVRSEEAVKQLIPLCNSRHAIYGASVSASGATAEGGAPSSLRDAPRATDADLSKTHSSVTFTNAGGPERAASPPPPGRRSRRRRRGAAPGEGGAKEDARPATTVEVYRRRRRRKGGKELGTGKGVVVPPRKEAQVKHTWDAFGDLLVIDVERYNEGWNEGGMDRGFTSELTSQLTLK